MHPFRMRFSHVEVQHLVRAWLVISLSFAIMKNGSFSLTPVFFVIAGISAVTVGIGFLLHELMHKYFAQKYGCRAEFRAFDLMLIIAFLMALFKSPIFFAAPGAVFIQGNVNPARNGRISAAGPMTNIVLAVLFLGVKVFLVPIFPSGLLYYLADFGASVNAWLAVFNMLPLMGLDGSKVLFWNMKVYGALLTLAIAAMVLTYAM
ncbi:site-2 protease family protein [Candidatus Woesearchaeota archaeon]|nr:site-2 protease family protein [Candidatus Woesearchaeota archaeon]